MRTKQDDETCSGLGFVLPPPWRLQTAVTPGELPGGGGTPRQDHRCQPSQVYIPCGANRGLLRAPSPQSSKLEALGSPFVTSFPPLGRFFGTCHPDKNRRRREPPACRVPVPSSAWTHIHSLPTCFLPQPGREQSHPRDSRFCPKAQMPPQPFLLVSPRSTALPNPSIQQSAGPQRELPQSLRKWCDKDKNKTNTLTYKRPKPGHRPPPQK